MTANHAEHVRSICAEIAEAVLSAPVEQVDAFIAALESADRIFVFGEGRSGLVLRMGAMRLVHLGKTVHVVGDATTPAISAGDVLVVGSGSGETAVTVLIAEGARKAGASVLAITASPASRLALLADSVVVLGTPAKGRAGGGQSIQPGGTLFEQSMLILFDTVFLTLAGDDAETRIAQRHANLE
jgi:6-phospho-3-hexuloisomerase